MKLKPFNNYLIVEKAKVEEITHGGLILPHDNDSDAPVWQGTVIETSDERFKEGETILFNRFTPAEFEHESKDLLALKSEDVIATLCP